MPLWKIDLLLQQEKQGAAESYYLPADTFADAGTAGVSLISPRRAILSDVARVQGMRVTAIDDIGLLTKPSKAYNREEFDELGTTLMRRDVTDIAVLMQGYNADASRLKTTWLRFVPDRVNHWDELTGKLTPDAGWVAAFDAFANTLINASAQLRFFDDDETSNPASEAITTVKVDPDGLLSVVMQAANAEFFPGMRVKVKGYSGSLTKQVNGMTKILGIVGTEVFLDKMALQHRGTQTPGGGAFLFGERYAFEPITQIARQFDYTRETGSAFFVRRGRRSKKPTFQFTRAVAI